MIEYVFIFHVSHIPLWTSKTNFFIFRKNYEEINNNIFPDIAQDQAL